MKRMYLIKSFLVATVAGGIALSASFAQITSLVTGELALSETFVESREGGQNFDAYSEIGTFPDGWSNSSAKSTAPGLTPGIGSRFNSAAGFTWDPPGVGGSFSVSPTLPTAGGIYDIYVTVTGESGPLDVITDVSVTGGSGLPSTTDAFTVSLSQLGDRWNFVGTLILDAGVDTPTIQFTENMHDNRLYADGVAFVQVIPEPSTYAAIFGGLALVGAFVYRRRRMNTTK